MATVIWGGAEFPVLSFSYTAAVGISPQTAMLRVVPGDADPAPFGDLTFGDGDFALTLTDCLLTQARASYSQGGRVWDLAISDRRWMWEIGPAVRGQYNQIDSHGKLIPWTVRSPYQLAVLCLEALGEEGYAIDLPGGLAAPAGDGIPDPGPDDAEVDVDGDYLNMGENLPPTSTAPPVSWNEVPAAQALANLAEQFGRVVVFDPVTDAVSIQAEGGGAGLPDGPVLNSSPALTPKQMPATLEVVGSPTRFQVRLRCRPVGRDWDDSYQRYADLTYAPTGLTPKNMKVWFENTGGGFFAPLTVNGVDFNGLAGASDTAASTDMADQINSSTDPRVAGVVTASVDTAGGPTNGVLVLTAVKPGVEFWYDLHGNTGFVGHCVDGPIAGGAGFESCPPPAYPAVTATDRLNYRQARELAAASVYRLYQVVAVDPFDDTKQRIAVPLDPDDDNDIREIKNPFQLILQASRPDQIVPRPGDVNRVDPLTGQPFAAEAYNGYSRDRAPAAFGSIHLGFINPSIWAKVDGTYLNNTARNSQFYAPAFRVVDPERQVVAFSEPVYRVLGGEKDPSGNAGTAAFLPVDLVIETGVLLLEDDTLTPERFSLEKDIPGGEGPTLTVLKPDVQKEIIGDYDENHQLTGCHAFDDDADFRANYYAEQIAAKYQTTAGLMNAYAGLVAVSLSGVVRQVHWELSAQGFTTTAGANTEFSTVVLPYPARRRRENLPPDALQAIQNAQSNSTNAPATRLRKMALGGAVGGLAFGH